MKTYNIIKVGKKEICYRVYGSRTGNGIEIVNGIDPVNCGSAKRFFGWWAFEPVKEAKLLYRLTFGKLRKGDLEK